MNQDENENPLVNTKEAARFLSIKPMTLYCGESGTGHLKKRKLGSRTVRWYMPQLKAHRENIIRHGTCDGECNKVFEDLEKAPAPEQVSPFSLVKTAKAKSR